jgi:hypothetical protein
MRFYCVKVRERDTNSICFTLEVAEYFIRQLCEADWLTRAHDSRCTEASQLPSFVSVSLKKGVPLLILLC